MRVRVGYDVEKFRSDHGRDHQDFAMLDFKADGGGGFGAGRVVIDGKLDEDVGIQPNHSLSYISSAISARVKVGIRTLWPFSGAGS